MIMTLEEHRAKNTLALRSWRHRNREHYRTISASTNAGIYAE